MTRPLALAAPTLLAAALVAGCGPAANGRPEFTAAEMERAAASRSDLVGRKAPPFTLMNQDEKPVSLGDLAGKWVVLYFYPKDDTPGCACQANEFTELLWKFRNMDAVVYGVSADSPASHRRFMKKYGLELNLLSDPDHDMMASYGAWVSSSLGTMDYGRVVRTTFLIGPDGTIRHHWPEVIPEGHAARVRDKLAELQARG